MRPSTTTRQRVRSHQCRFAAVAAASLLFLALLLSTQPASAATDAASTTTAAAASPAPAGDASKNEAATPANVAPAPSSTAPSPSPSPSSSPLPPLDAALRSVASSFSPKAASVFLANSRRNFSAEAQRISSEYALVAAARARNATMLARNSTNITLPRPGAASSSLSSFAASGRLPPFGSQTAMQPERQVGFQACSITLSATPPSGSTAGCSPVTLSAKVSLPGGNSSGGPASGVVVFGDNGVALGPVQALAPDGTASINVTSLLPGKHNLLVWYLRGGSVSSGGGGGGQCNEGFSAPLLYTVSKAPAVVTVRSSPQSLSSPGSSNGTKSSCSLKDVAFDVAVSAPGGVRDCATPGGVVTLYLVKGRLSSVSAWSGPLLLQAKEAVASAGKAAADGVSSTTATAATATASGGGGVFRSQAKKKATDALFGAASSAANSVARIFARQVGGDGGGGGGGNGVSGNAADNGGGITVAGLDLGKAASSAKAAASALAALGNAGENKATTSPSTSTASKDDASSFGGLPAPLARAIAQHLASRVIPAASSSSTSDEAREAAKDVIAAAAPDDESAEIAASAIDAAAAAEAADDRRHAAAASAAAAAAAAATPTPTTTTTPPTPTPDATTKPSATATAARTETTATPTPQATRAPTAATTTITGGVFSHLPHLPPPPLPSLLPPGKGTGRGRRRLRDWRSDIQSAVASDPLLHRVLGAGVLLPTELVPGSASHAALGAAKLKVGINPPGEYTLVAQYSGDSRFERAAGIAPFEIDASCGWFT